MTRDDKIKRVCEILAHYRTMPYALAEGAEIARELLAGMEEKPLDPDRIYCLEYIDALNGIVRITPVTPEGGNDGEETT